MHYLSEAQARAKALHVPCEFIELESERPYQTIIDTAAERGCDLIAMASHGRRRLPMSPSSRARDFLTLARRSGRKSSRLSMAVIGFCEQGGVPEQHRMHNIPHAHVCGGRGRCSTCRIRIIGGHSKLSIASVAERAVLDRVKAGMGVRLACQLRPDHDVSFVPLLPPQASVANAYKDNQPHSGYEHYVVIMFVDMRDSTKLAERLCPVRPRRRDPPRRVLCGSRGRQCPPLPSRRIGVRATSQTRLLPF
jgi:ferredoxin